MKTHLVLTGLIVSFLLAQPASAAILTFDENGNGEFGPGVLQLDPGPGGLPFPVLTYRLPFAGVPGDVLLTDADVAGNPFLDVIRFNGNGTLVFYSDNVGGVDALADTPSPPTALYPNQVRIPEVGPEGNNGAFYTPGPNDPGFDPSLPTYHLISDSPVPEPASVSLLAVGAALGGLIVLKRRRNSLCRKAK
jgi:hypothetical protein